MLYVNSIKASLALLIISNLNFQAQTKDSISMGRNRPRLGFSINQFQNDFGLGLNFTSPTIKNKVSFRLRANVQWLQHTKFADSVTTWTPYYNLSFSTVLRQEIIPHKLYVYTEGGLVFVLPSKDFASYDFKFGGVGLFGFEFIHSKIVSQFFEAGGVGLGTIADRIALKPIYSNGLVIMTGLRFSL
jgi:hypothetical protein